jgi:transcriptional regulator with XRE-family HTH domain
MTDDHLPSLTSLIRRRIDDLEISQAAYAERIGISPQHLSGLLKSKIALPRPEVRRRLAADLGLTHLDLLVNAGELSAEEARAGSSERGVVFSADDDRLAVARRLKALSDEDLDRLVDFLDFLERGESRRRRSRDREQQGDEGTAATVPVPRDVH